MKVSAWTLHLLTFNDVQSLTTFFSDIPKGNYLRNNILGVQEVGANWNDIDAINYYNCDQHDNHKIDVAPVAQNFTTRCNVNMDYPVFATQHTLKQSARFTKLSYMSLNK